jgi:hypothetical protein
MYFYDDLFKVNVMTILTNNKNNNKTKKRKRNDEYDINDHCLGA